MIALSLQAAQEVSWAIDYIVGHATDNSCGDLDCCGGPYYDDDTAAEYAKTLLAWGIKIIE